MTTHDIGKTERMEMYLKAIYIIQSAYPPVTVSKVAEFLALSLPSASEMLKRLEQNRFVSAADDGLHLTKTGAKVASQVVRRLRLAERLFTDILGLELFKVYEEACKLEHVISEEVEGKLMEVLGRPTTCPHGHLIPYEDTAIPNPPEKTLADVKENEHAVVESIPEEDPEMVRYLHRLGLVPKARLSIDEIAPFNGPIFFSIDGNRQAIGRDAASRVRLARAA